MKDINTFLEYLTNIEHVFDEYAYVQGEETFDRAEISLSHQKNSLFTLKVKDKLNYEVELKLSSKKLDRHSCDCLIFQKNKSCSHIAAAYLYIRKFLLSQDEKPKPKRQMTSRRKKSIKEVLQETNHDDLLTFVQSYARTDKKFATAVRVHFLSQATKTDSATIRSILDSIIPPVSTANKKLANSDWQLFIRTLDNFKEQVKDAISLSNFDFASNVIAAVLTKLYYSITKFGVKEAQANSYLEIYTELTKDLFEQIEAPLAKERIVKIFLPIQEKSYFRNYISFDFLHVLLDHDVLDQKQIRGIIDGLKSHDHDIERTRIHTLSLILRMTSRFEQQIDIEQQVFPSNLHAKILEEIFEEEDFNCLKKVFNSTALKIDELLTLEFQYKINLEEKKYKKVFEILYALIKRTQRISFYKAIKGLYPESITKTQLNKVKKLIDSWPLGEQLPFLLFEERYADLCNALISICDTEVSFKYDPSVPDDYDDILIELYRLHVNSYLDHHVGISSTETIKTILNHLKKYKSKKLQQAVQAHISKSYGDRKSIKSLLNNP